MKGTKRKKNKIGAILLICCIIAGLCACNGENTEENLTVEEEIIVPGPYEEYVMDSMRGTTLSIKVPESFLIYGEDTIDYQSEQVIYLVLNVNDGTDPEIEEKLRISLYEEDGSISSNQTKLDYVTETQKDLFKFELVKEKETENVHTLWIEGVDPEHNFERRSSMMRKVVNYVDLGEVVVCCELECDYSLKAHEEIVSFKEFEKIVDSVVLEIMEQAINETVASSEAVESSAESTASVETKDNTAPVEVTYEKHDWRSAGFYVDGNYGKLPMTYEELEQIGFGKLTNDGKPLDELNEKFSYIEGRRSHDYTIEAYNEAGEELIISFANEAEIRQHIKDCTIYAIRFTRPDHEIRSGEEVELCNGLTWGSTHEEAIALMGEPDKRIELTNEYGFNGDLQYYFDETTVGKYLTLTFFKNELESIFITKSPIK